jgi:acylphosphatase
MASVSDGNPGKRQNVAMSDATVRRHLVVHGRVQGVFFRDSTREKAENEGVVGWARNLDDGSVEVVLEGEPEAVENVVHYCRLGPVRAEVTSVEVTEEPPEGLVGFETR